ncbi:hypothetical protein [Flavobacterium reichenbachii]|uniref:Uncharacterized protein n=1 Tax=Flavobacterium reichenbachii TaxID=362418 RepID=A0A085ZQN8_9FLAO|nr:hypothetical protein [Flavobacterium reichenbachii]KFF06752.1 hypothetical protein IW19_15110 [Flavobacterium reichenbachii]OXB18645.1 hypothetical protein B0A68_01100 [Flavobacterium reichenbachii]
MDNKILAIRYAIFKVAQDFLAINSRDLNDIVFFNESNNFSIKKCLLLPFIVTIANGKKEQLMEGIFNLSFFPDIEKLEGVRIGKINADTFEIYDSEQLELKFENSRLIFEFKENEFTDLDVKIKAAIDYSIKFLKERRIERFSSLSSLELSKISMNNDAFECLLENIETKKFTNIDNISLVKEFQKYIMEFPFYLSLVKELEEDII